MQQVTGNIHINKEIPVPLYFQLKQEITAMIDGGALKPGDMLPTETELCAALGISRPTVRQAYGELVSDGHLYRQKGKGTFVASRKIDARFFTKLETFNSEMRQKGLEPSTQVVEFKVVSALPEVCGKLGLPGDEPLIYLERLRYTNGEPVVHVRTWLPLRGLEGLLAEDLQQNSLYDLLENKFNRRVSRVSRKIEAVNAGAEDCRMLQMKKRDAVCLVKTTAYTAEEEPVEYSVARYRGDRNRFSVDLFR